jgi:hypothetical protein
MENKVKNYLIIATNITMANYHIILSFKTYEELAILRCISENKILDYFE